MKTTRTYTMRSRATAVEETRRHILTSTYDLSSRRLITDITLEDVARGAGVSVQTVLRQFGSRAGLLEATSTYATEAVRAERRAAPGDLVGGLRTLVDHYEHRGDATVLLLAQEDGDDSIRSVTDHGKQLHRTWVRDLCAPWLAELPEAEAEELLDLLVVATDVYAWKLLRRDRALPRHATESRMLRLVRVLLAAPTPPPLPEET